MDQFHTLGLTQRIPAISRLADGRLRALGRRLQYVEAPQLMDDSARCDFDASNACRLMAPCDTIPGLNYSQAIAKIDDMIATAAGDEDVLLAGHPKYLREQTAWVRSFMN